MRWKRTVGRPPFRGPERLRANPAQLLEALERALHDPGLHPRPGRDCTGAHDKLLHDVQVARPVPEGEPKLTWPHLANDELEHGGRRLREPMRDRLAVRAGRVQFNPHARAPCRVRAPAVLPCRPGRGP